MKKHITSLIIATALVNTGAYSQDHIASSDVLVHSKFQDANNLGFTVIGETPKALQKENDASIVYQRNQSNDLSSQVTTYAWTAVQWSATATVIGATLLYGNAAIFWGTYYTTSYLMNLAGFSSFNSFVGATNAAIAVVNSSLAKGALSGAAGLIMHHGSTLAAEAGKFALKTTGAAARDLWFWGTGYVMGTSQTSSLASQAAAAA